jgi:hypothetical protein
MHNRRKSAAGSLGAQASAGSAGILPAMSATRREQSGVTRRPALTLQPYRHQCFLINTGIIIIRRRFIQLRQLRTRFERLDPKDREANRPARKGGIVKWRIERRRCATICRPFGPRVTIGNAFPALTGGATNYQSFGPKTCCWLNLSRRSEHDPLTKVTT